MILVGMLMSKLCYISVDCWDGPNDEPIIYHGHTLTSKISFKAAIDAVNEYAFVASEYVILNSFCEL